jgi:hypothetical protein
MQCKVLSSYLHRIRNNEDSLYYVDNLILTDWYAGLPMFRLDVLVILIRSRAWRCSSQNIGKKLLAIYVNVVHMYRLWEVSLFRIKITIIKFMELAKFIPHFNCNKAVWTSSLKSLFYSATKDQIKGIGSRGTPNLILYAECH